MADPATHEATLRAGCEAMGLALSADEASALICFNALLQRWNSVYNLTSVRDLDSALILHLLDCLAAVRPLRRRMGQLKGRDVLDVGSGGGLPGVVFAITNPAVQVTCVDAVGKKAAFVTQAAAELRLRNLTAVHGRVESLDGAFDLIASRAFSSLSDFTRLTSALRKPTGVWMAMKGKEPSHEIAELPSQLMFHVEHLHVPDLVGERCIVWIAPRDGSQWGESA